jgi:protein-tyrosine phosphatase
MADIPEDGADFLLALAPGPLPPWPHRRVSWPDYWVPLDRSDALDAFREALRRARAGEVVEVACHGGRGRTGTAIAAMAVIEGCAARDAVRWVREHYDRRAIEMPWQAWWVRLVPRGGA